MSFGTVAAVGSALIGAGATVYAANKSSSASDRATDATLAATEAQIQAAREQYQNTLALFSDYLQDGAVADAWLRALYEGEATYTPGAGGAAAAQSRNMTEAEAREAFPELYALWQDPGQDGIAGNMNRYPSFLSFAAANGMETRVTGAQGGAQNQAAPITITRDQVMQAINGTPMAQAATEWLNARNALDSDTYSGAQDLAQAERADLEGVANNQYGLYVDRAGEALAGRRADAQHLLDLDLANNAAIKSAWDAKAQDEMAKAIDLIFSRGGVTGLIGQTREGVAQVGQQYALDAYGLDAQLNRDAYQPYGERYYGAGETYWGDLANADDYLGAARTYAAVNYGNRNQNAYDQWRTSTRGNYDAYTQDWQRNYADFLENNLGLRSSRGQTSRNVISGAGADMTDRISSAYGAQGTANANNALRQGEIQQQLYGDLANIAGNAVGAIFNRKGK